MKNTQTNSNLSERDAIRQGVIDDNRVTYTDKTTGKQVLIADAIQVNHTLNRPGVSIYRVKIAKLLTL